MNKTKKVIQLDEDGYFKGVTSAQASPLERGKWLMPKNSIDGEAPVVPDGKKAKWSKDKWVFETIPAPEPEPEQEETSDVLTYAEKRANEYPDIGDQLDDLYWNGAFSDEMSAKIRAVKAKYPALRPSGRRKKK